MCHIFPLAFAMPGGFELLIIAGIAILLFGHRLPSVMGSFGKSIRVFRSEMEGNESSLE